MKLLDDRRSLRACSAPRRIIVLASFVAATGCRTNAPVYNVNDAPIAASTANPTLDDVAKAIQRAGASLGWEMRRTQPGHVVGTLHLRSHVAVVDVSYGTRAYSIRYVDSRGLHYDGQTIHPNYNGWIKRLNDAIRAQLLTL